mmetsp:Transcript_56204/g.142438  ORF Transcript_56204/g.142438 Transcript_56204/m.142438 type:complete len:254 (+) Transcript_56204:416-1177(+)
MPRQKALIAEAHCAVPVGSSASHEESYPLDEREGAAKSVGKFARLDGCLLLVSPEPLQQPLQSQLLSRGSVGQAAGRQDAVLEAESLGLNRREALQDKLARHAAAGEHAYTVLGRSIHEPGATAQLVDHRLPLGPALLLPGEHAEVGAVAEAGPEQRGETVHLVLAHGAISQGVSDTSCGAEKHDALWQLLLQQGNEGDLALRILQRQGESLPTPAGLLGPQNCARAFRSIDREVRRARGPAAAVHDSDGARR